MLRYRVLGPLEVVDADGRRVDVGSRQPRVFLAVLLVAGAGPIVLMAEAALAAVDVATLQGAHAFAARAERAAGLWTVA